MKKLTTLIALMFVLSISKAQTIPNAGFENWTNFGTYSNPTNWDSYNMYHPLIPTCEQGTPGASGNSFLNLTVKNTATFLNWGAAFLANYDPILEMMYPGFAVNSRPANFTGKWKYLVSATDTSVVAVEFYKWNPVLMMSELIGEAYKEIMPGTVTNWSNFSIPVDYFTNDVPDSALIILIAGVVENPPLNDYLYIDDLAFNGNVPTAINEVAEDIKLTIAPNPFDHYTTIHFSEQQTNTVIQIIDVLGNTIRTEQFTGDKYIIERGRLSAGIYIVQIQDKMNHIVSKKIAIQ